MDDGWLYVERTEEGTLYAASLRGGFDHRFDHHVALRIDYRARRRSGLPEDVEHGWLRGLERRLIDDLGGDGELVATETTDGVRTLHLFVGARLAAQFRRRARRGKWGGVVVSVVHDPAWSRVEHLVRLAD